MDELNNNENLREQIQEEEISITDKMVGVLSEPSSLFEKLSNVELKTMDWLVPILLVIIVAAISNFVLMGNPEIRAEVIEKQISLMEKSFQEQVNKGNMTQEKADEIIENTTNRMEEGGSTQSMMASVGIFFLTFLTFFLVTGIFHLLTKFGLGGVGSYKTAMTAYGLPYYILALQIIVTIILAMAMNKFLMDTSIGTILDMKRDTLTGMLAHKLDIFSIWFYAVVSIAFAKMFKSDSTIKYFILVFGLWIGTSILMHLLAQAIPFLKMFGM